MHSQEKETQPLPPLQVSRMDKVRIRQKSTLYSLAQYVTNDFQIGHLM